MEGTERGHQFFNLAFVQQLVLMGGHPAFLLGLPVGKQLASQVPEVLSGVVKVDNLNRAGEVLIGDIPDPFRSIADDDLLFGATPTSLAGFPIDAQAKLLCRFNRSHISRRTGIAEGEAFLVPGRLRKHASQLGLPRVGRLPFDLALAADGFLLHHRHSGPVHLHVQNRHRFAHDHRQIQLHSPLDLLLLARGDIRSNGLRRSLYGFGGHLQIGEQFHLRAPLIERSLLTTTACMRRTPGETSVFSMSSSTSTGNWPVWQCAHK
jgi:hypothetical protein